MSVMELLIKYENAYNEKPDRDDYMTDEDYRDDCYGSEMRTDSIEKQINEAGYSVEFVHLDEAGRSRFILVDENGLPASF